MANRYPLILDTSDNNRLKELPSGDALDLTGNTITGVGNITSNASVSAVSFSGTSANLTEITTSTILLGGQDVGDNIAAKADTANLSAVAFSNDYNDLSNAPTVPTDISDLTDAGGLLSTGRFTSLSDTPDFYDGSAGLFVRVNLAENGLEFAVGSGAITNDDIINALGYTPYSSLNPDGYINSSIGVTTALGYTPYNATNPDNYITAIDSNDVTNALGYTPYDATNPSGYINSSIGITTALGYTPYDATNPDGFIDVIVGSDVITALGYTPYDATNPSGYITAINSGDVTTALGYTPYDATNPDSYITLSSLTGTGDITYNNTTGTISFNNSSGYLTAEADTLATVTGRGTTTLLTITAGGFTTTGTTSTNDLTVSGNLSLTSTGTIAFDGAGGSTIAIGGTSNLSLRDASGSIDVQASLVPNTSGSLNIGSVGSVFNNVYANTLNSSDIAFTASPATMTMTGNLEITPGSATSNIRLTRGVLGLSSITTAARNSLGVLQNGYIIFNSTTNQYQGYSGTRGSEGPGWVNLWHGEPGGQPASPYTGQIAIADGTAWDPLGNGGEAMMVYIRGGWVLIV